MAKTVETEAPNRCGDCRHFTPYNPETPFLGGVCPKMRFNEVKPDWEPTYAWGHNQMKPSSAVILVRNGWTCFEIRERVLDKSVTA